MRNKKPYMASTWLCYGIFYQGRNKNKSMTKAYEDDLKQKRDEILRKCKRFAKQNCKHCYGDGIITVVVGQRKNIRRDILKTCTCVTKNMSLLDDIKKGKIKYPEDWELKDRVVNVIKENGK